MNGCIKRLHITVISSLFAVAAVVGFPFAVDADINDGIIGAWTFDDGDVTDSIGKNHGELFKAAKVVNDGKFGRALDVDGSVDTRADIMVDDAFEAALEKQFSVAYWLFVRQGQNHSGVWKGEKVGWGANFTFRLVTTSSNDFTWGMTQGGTECWFATAGAIEPNKWIHVCLTADGKQGIGYVTKEGEKAPKIPNSAEGNPKACPTPYNLFPDRPIELGAGRGIGGVVGTDTFLNGLIDEVYIWDRALTEEEVTELGQGARPTKALAVESHGKFTTTWAQIKSTAQPR